MIRLVQRLRREVLLTIEEGRRVVGGLGSGRMVQRGIAQLLGIRIDVRLMSVRGLETGDIRGARAVRVVWIGICHC